MNDKIHIRMERKMIMDYTYCGQVILGKMLFVTQDFYLPMVMMCYNCIDEWENEDIRMQTPTKNIQ